jgi:hypothetical protein
VPDPAVARIICSICCSNQRPSLALRDLLFEGIPQDRGLELVLAEKIEFAAGLKAEEIEQAVFTDALSSGRGEQHAIDMGKTCGVIPGSARRQLAEDRQLVAFGNFARRKCLALPCGTAGAVPPRDSAGRGGV